MISSDIITYRLQRRAMLEAQRAHDRGLFPASAAILTRGVQP